MRPARARARGAGRRAAPGRARSIIASDDATLGAGASAQIYFTVDVANVTDEGLGFGMFEAQVMTGARTAAGLVTTDLSDAGTNPNPGSSAGGPGNDDPTAFSVGITPSIGAALTTNNIIHNSNGTHTVSLQLAVENLGEAELDNVAITLDLNSVFGVGNFSMLNSSVRNARYKANSGE